MKRNLFTLSLVLAGVGVFAQSPRTSLYEEFTGETCPPCASTNPGLNTLLLSATNATRVVAIKWQVPIPSAPSNTWSLYQTNKTEIDWRWKSVASGGYGYTPAINSAPSSKIDGREATVFGATSGHPANLNNTVISNAVSQASAFNIIMTRSAITNTSTSAVVNVTVQATAPYNTTSNLVFRTVLVERLIQFSVQPGTNGETKFEDAARKSYPTLQSGTALTQTWTQGQTMTFSMNCAFPSYIRSNLEIEFVGFIQNDGTQMVEQVNRTGMTTAAFDAVASSVNPPFSCSSSNTMAPSVPVKNAGQSDITALTITPYVDGIAKTPTQWTGVINPGFSGFITLNAFNVGTVSGQHTFSYTISGLNSTDNNSANNGAAGSFFAVSNYSATPVSEGFVSAAFPPAGWGLNNSNGGAAWSKINTVGGFNLSTECSKYDFYNNSVIGDQDDMFLPAMNLAGANDPILTFDVAYAQRTINSNDKLEVRVSDNCGTSWTTVYSQAGSALSTAPITSGAYTPPTNNDSHWRTETVTLVGFNKAAVLVKFVAINGNGNNVYIDNVNLSQSSPTGISKIASGNFKATLFPNPSNGVTTLNISAVNSSNAKISVVNTLGQVVFAKQVSIEAGNNNFQIDVKDFASGLYSVIIDSSNGSMVKKLTVTK